MSTDETALRERLAAAICAERYDCAEAAGWATSCDHGFGYRDADVLLPVVAQEVAAARAEALRKVDIETKRATYYAKGREDGRAEVVAKVEALCNAAERHADTYKRACIVTTGQIRDALGGDR